MIHMYNFQLLFREELTLFDLTWDNTPDRKRKTEYVDKIFMNKMYATF